MGTATVQQEKSTAPVNDIQEQGWTLSLLLQLCTCVKYAVGHLNSEHRGIHNTRVVVYPKETRSWRKDRFIETVLHFLLKPCASTVNKQISQNHWVFGLCPSSGILNTREHNVSETDLMWGEVNTFSVGPLDLTSITSVQSNPVIEVSSF
jgi:hypothetical protein